MKTICILMIMTMMAQPPVEAQTQAPLTGSFRTFSDIGSPGMGGRAYYMEPAQEYLLEGSGENIWFGEDSFSFLWKEMEGDFIIQAQVEFIGEGSHEHRKAGLMIRQGLSAGASHVSCTVHGDGLTSLQYRDGPGSDMQEIRFDLSGPGVIQLEKKGDTFTMSAARFGQLYQTRTLELELSGPLMAGLFICSHIDSLLEQAMFRNVRIFGTAPDSLVPYRDYIGSLLEVMDVETGQRIVLGGAAGSWQAPNWTPDGKSLIYNADGMLYRFDLESRISEVLPTGFANRNNNDHAISFDGRNIAISHHAEENSGESVIYTLPLGGGTPEKITPLGPSYLHGWSTDDRYLVYTASRGGEYNIYRIPSAGGEEVQLTHTGELDDGPEYSPDGRYIYFNSCRTGTMQIWRMDPDGSHQTQLTSDEYNNWFPHISPDGRWIVFISFPPEIEADSHPFYKRVYLRMMSAEELEPRVIGYLYGGQGSMNVPSWSPDSRNIAFISNGMF